jgi:ABC-2 type transport system ATP-binding protein
MNLRAFRVFGWLALSAGVTVVALASVNVAPPLARLDLPLSLVTAVTVACLLFAALSRDAPWPRRPLPGRVGPLSVRGVYLTVTSAAEEVLWRWLLLGGLAPLVGLAPAAVASTVGFALAHGTRKRDVFAVHLVTGSGFGAVFVGTGRIEAAILAHAVYNWLVVAAIESGAPGEPLPATIGDDSPAVLDDVHKRYGEVEALRGFSLAVHHGEVVALLGPNGAGKTTAMSILLGLRAPDKGTARLFGRDPRGMNARRWLGATPQETGFPTTLKVREVVDLVRVHYPAPLETADVLAQFRLTDVAGRQVGGLSAGQKRRLAVAVAFAGNPSAVLLDEPTTGLDVETRHRVWDVVRTHADGGRTVLLTTHHLEEAEALASRVVVISGGATLAEGSPREVKERVGLRRVRVEIDVLPELTGVAHATRAGRVHVLYVADPGKIVEQLVACGASLERLEVTSVTLEEAFLFLTRRPE